MVREIQTDPVSDSLVHVDFCEIDLNKERTYVVPVSYKGTAKGVDLGGILTVNVRTVVLKGKPMDIPNSCEVNVSGLAIGDKITCQEIAIPENVALLTKGKEVAVSVMRPAQKAAAK